MKFGLIINGLALNPRHVMAAHRVGELNMRVHMSRNFYVGFGQGFDSVTDKDYIEFYFESESQRDKEFEDLVGMIWDRPASLLEAVREIAEVIKEEI